MSFLVADGLPERVTFTPRDDTTGIALASVSVVFIGPPAPNNSSASAAPATVIADGVQSSTITVNLRDINNVPVPGRPVVRQQGRGHSLISPGVPVTRR